jgi:hypothetical protein
MLLLLGECGCGEEDGREEGYIRLTDAHCVAV